MIKPGIFPLLVIMLFQCDTSFAQWQYEGSPDIGSPIDLYVDGEDTYLYTSAGLFHSANDGSSWQELKTPSFPIYAEKIIAKDEHLYLIASYDPKYFVPLLYRSGDHGKTWTDITSRVAEYNNLQIFVTNGDTLLISSAISKDAGYHFEAYPIAGYLSEDAFFIGSILYSGSLRTANLGLTWHPIFNSMGHNGGYLFNTGERLYYLELWGDTIHMHRTDNLGGSWQSTGPPFYFNVLNPAMVVYENTIIVYNKYETDSLAISINGGESFERISNIHQISKFCATSSGILAITPNAVLKTVNGKDYLQAQNHLNSASVIEINNWDKNLWVKANTKLFRKPITSNIDSWEELEYDKMITTETGGLFIIQNGIPKYSLDGGLNFTTLLPEAFFSITYPVFTLAQSLNNIMYVAANFYIVYSLDAGVTWNYLHWPPIDHQVYRMEYSGGKYLTGSLSLGGKLLTSDDGISWELFPVNLPINSYKASKLHFHKDYYFAFGDNHLWRIGIHEPEWQRIILPVPLTDDLPIQNITLDSYGDLLIAGIHGYGVFVSKDNGLHWSSANYGLTDFHALSSAQINDTLYLGVDGGVWKRPLPEFRYQEFTGRAYNDLNANGIMDPNEDGIENIIVKKRNQEIFTSTKSDGAFTIMSANDNTDIIETGDAPLYSEIRPSKYTVGGSRSDLNFGIHYLPGHYDASIWLYHTIPYLYAEDTNTLKIVVSNAGTEKSTFRVNLIPDTHFVFDNADIDPSSFSGDTISWILEMGPLEEKTITFTVITSYSFPEATILSFVAEVNIIGHEDEELSNNLSMLNINSNFGSAIFEKKVYPDSLIPYDLVKDTIQLKYNIRFTHPYIETTSGFKLQEPLSSNLDISSFRLNYAYPECTWQLLEGNIVEFNFSNQTLSSCLASQDCFGVIDFSIDAKDNLKPSDYIENIAYVFFQDEDRQRSNKVVTYFTDGVVSTNSPLQLEFAVFPIPTRDIIQITLQNHINPGQSFVILSDLSGRKCYSAVFEENDFKVDISHLPAGIYFLGLRNNNTSGTVSILKI